MIDIRAPAARLQRIEVAPRYATEATLIEDPLERGSTDARPNRTVGAPLLIEVPGDAQLAVAVAPRPTWHRDPGRTPARFHVAIFIAIGNDIACLTFRDEPPRELSRSRRVALSAPSRG